jgi:hypothetical protein
MMGLLEFKTGLEIWEFAIQQADSECFMLSCVSRTAVEPGQFDRGNGRISHIQQLAFQDPI